MDIRLVVIEKVVSIYHDILYWLWMEKVFEGIFVDLKLGSRHKISQPNYFLYFLSSSFFGLFSFPIFASQDIKQKCNFWGPRFFLLLLHSLCVYVLEKEYRNWASTHDVCPQKWQFLNTCLFPIYTFDYKRVLLNNVKSFFLGHSFVESKDSSSSFTSH